jgi:antitoxin (DNA-binding transcriptional repressor) of toxin-antitoxin stability system
MIQVNILEMKTKLSQYLDKVVAGERVIICRHNRPIAELRAVEGARSEPRPIGPLPGRPTFDLPASFFEPLTEDEMASWDGIGDDVLSPAAKARTATRASSRVAETRERPPSPRRTGRRRP